MADFIYLILIALVGETALGALLITAPILYEVWKYRRK